MVNHLRTLLLNKRAGTGDTFIPPEFAPVVLPLLLTRLREIFIPSTDVEVATVDLIMQFLHHPELAPYTLRFDPRITYATESQAKLLDLAGNDTPEVSRGFSMYPKILTQFASTPDSAALFRWPEYTDDLQALRLTWTTASEGFLKLGAAVLAFGYQVERQRRLS